MSPYPNFHSIKLEHRVMFHSHEALFQQGMELAVTSQAKGQIKQGMDLSRLVLESQASYLYNVEVLGSA